MDIKLLPGSMEKVKGLKGAVNAPGLHTLCKLKGMEEVTVCGEYDSVKEKIRKSLMGVEETRRGWKRKSWEESVGHDDDADEEETPEASERKRKRTVRLMRRTMFRQGQAPRSTK